MRQLLPITAHKRPLHQLLTGVIPFALVLGFVLGLLMLYQGLTELPVFWRVLLGESVRNPFVGLFIGMLATSLIQSSSLSTSLIVAMGGSGLFSVESAIPVMVGANLGTVMTVTIEELKADTRHRIFLRAASVLMLQDIFNLLTAVLLLPIELNTHIVANSLMALPHFTLLSDVVPSLFTGLPASLNVLSGVVVTALSVRGWIGFWIQRKRMRRGRTFQRMLSGRVHEVFFYGFCYTATLQSSSRMMGLFIGSMPQIDFSLRRVFTLLTGANVGTTVTALFAALLLPFPALAIALVHLLFNMLGALLFHFLPLSQQLATRIAEYLGKAILRQRLLGFAYIFTVFFLTPFLLIVLSR